jgi:hypothetical protein
MLRQDMAEIPIVTSLQGFHVTDDPTIVTSALSQGVPLDRGQDVSHFDDLLACGLYFSSAPQLWTGRAGRKWDFVSHLTEEQRVRIAEVVRNDRRSSDPGYLTSSEMEQVARYVQQFEETGNRVYLELLAGQPFNFHVWKQSFLSPLGIVNERLPHQILVEVEGTFADITNMRSISADHVRTLKHTGYDGMFVSASMALLPQAVVWNNSAVVRCGDYYKRK